MFINHSLYKGKDYPVKTMTINRKKLVCLTHQVGGLCIVNAESRTVDCRGCVSVVKGGSGGRTGGRGWIHFALHTELYTSWTYVDYKNSNLISVFITGYYV